MNIARAIRWINSHSATFATPQADGSVFIYCRFTYGDYGRFGRVGVRRERARTFAEVLRIMGY